MPAKSEQLQIRLTHQQKALLKRLARRAGVDVSSYVLSRVLPSARSKIAAALAELRRADDRRYALAELNDILTKLSSAEIEDALADCELDGLSAFLRNYVAAMVEQAANLKGVGAPRWVRDIEPLEEPYFAVPFPRLRPHLLRASPAAFKRRNIFIDSTVGDRV